MKRRRERTDEVMPSFKRDDEIYVVGWKNVYEVRIAWNGKKRGGVG